MNQLDDFKDLKANIKLKNISRYIASIHYKWRADVVLKTNLDLLFAVADTQLNIEITQNE